jgi:NEDD4-binding protein 2
MDYKKDIVTLYENNTSDRSVIILRGVSGAGKSTVANKFADPKVICTADDFFEKNGGYDFDPSKLGDAHRECQNKFECALQDPRIKNIVVANTNTKSNDYQYYLDMAAKHGIQVISLVIEKRHDNKNVHNVPDFVLQRQYDSLMSSLKLK